LANARILTGELVIGSILEHAPSGDFKMPHMGRLANDPSPGRGESQAPVSPASQQRRLQD